MPYVNEGVRSSLDDGRKPLSVGELNYLISKLVDGYLMGRGISYNTLNDAIGVLECAKLELYRRVAVPYENKKISENGDVYISASQV